MVYFLRMEILHYEKGIIMHQLNYELELLKRFELLSCKSIVTHAETNHKLDSSNNGEDVDVTTFKLLVGCLRYPCNTRLDICYAIGLMSKFMSKPKGSNYQVAIRILRNAKGTLRHGILFPSGVSDDAELICYSYSDWCGDKVNKIITT